PHGSTLPSRRDISQSSFTHPAPGDIHALSLHDALPIYADGKLDVAVAVTGGVSILLGNGDGTFQPFVTYAAGGFIGIAIGDLNGDRKSTRLNSSHPTNSYAVFCLQKNDATQPPTAVTAP